MSQPPQPPNQPPPGGGFGAPQEPSQGGFGAPQQPPAPPGAQPLPPPPAAPPAAPAGPPPVAPPGYTPAPPVPPAPPGHTPPQIWDIGIAPGAPGAAPDPSNPYAQQQFGAYPPAPGQPYGPPQPGSGGQGNKRKAIIIAAAVAVLIAAGGGVWAAVGGDDAKKPEAKQSTSPSEEDTGAPTTEPTEEDNPGGRDGGGNDPNDARQAGEAKVLFQTDGPEVAKSGVDIPGFWVMDDYVVKTLQEKVVAYESDGSEKWSITLPARVCAAPLSATGGKVVVAYEGTKKDECSNMALIDMHKGSKVWDKPIPEDGAFGGGHTSLGMAQSGNLVGMSWFGGSIVVKVSDGKTVPTAELSPACSVDGYAGGKVMLRSYSCTDGTSKLQKLDASTGKIKWSYSVRKGYQVNKIWSTSPAVIYIADEDRKSGGVLAISDSGKERSVLDMGKQSYQPQCGMDIFNTNIGGCQGVAASADTFYLPTEMDKASSGLGLSTEIHAFDLDTGKKKFEVKAAGRMMLPLAMDGKNLIAYEEPSYEEAGHVVSVGPSGGKAKTLLKLPAATKSDESGFYSARRIYANGNFYIASDRLTGTEGGEKVIMAFGP